MAQSTLNILSGPAEECQMPRESLGKYFHNCLKKRNHNDVINVDVFTGKELTCGDLLKDSITLAAAFNTLSLKKGDVISIASENTLHYCVPVLAALYLGIGVNPLNPAYKLDELKRAWSVSKPKVVFCSQFALENVLAVKNELDFLETIILMEPRSQSIPEIQTMSDLLATANIDTMSFKPDEFDIAEQIAFICQSSGTTGFSKGVLLTHENLMAPLGYLGNPRYGNLQDQDVSVGILPFFHIFGLVLQIGTIVTSAKLLVMSQFVPEVFLKAIQDYRATKLYIAPSLLSFFDAHPLVSKYDITSIKDIVCGAAPIGKELQERVSKKLPNINIRQVYGLTETCGGCTFQTADANDSGSVGYLIPNILAKVVNLETKQSVGCLGEGELCFKGSMITKGYAGNVDATKECMDEEGFYHTGDLGYYDKNGCFFLVERIKELIKYKGFQVPPMELETVILSHSDVKDCGVIGIPDERAGEVPLAYVVKQPGANVTEQEIVDLVAAKLSVQKHLYGGVRFVDAIPRNPAGKLLRRILIEMYNASGEIDVV